MHPSRDELSGFVLGTLSDRQADSITTHLEGCAECETALRELDSVSDAMIDDLRQGAPGSGYQQERAYQQMLAAIEPMGRRMGDGDVQTEPRPRPRQRAQHDLESVGVYNVLAKLGDGGMGTVYQAFHTKLKRVVALKVLRSDRLNTLEAVTRFEREMEAVGKLDHPNIVRATDAGEADGIHFLVMELIEGIDLSKLLQRCGRLEVADACEIIRQAAVGLAHACEHDLIHRDIKPSNLMLSVGQVSNLPSTGGESGRLETCPTVKILDLGLAALAESDSELTSTEQVMGTLAYMAPEQIRSSRHVDIRADIFSLGATLYKLLTGEYYDGLDPPTSINRLSGLVATELIGILQRMLARNPDDRFSTPVEVAEALRSFVEGADLTALLADAMAEVGASTTSGDTAESSFAPRKERSVRGANNDTWPRRAKGDGHLGRRFIAIATGLAGILLLGLVFYIVTDKGQLIVESEVDDVQMIVKRGNDVVDDFLVSTDGRSTSLRSGEYIIEMPNADFSRIELDRDQVTLSRGERAVVRIRRLEIASPMPGAATVGEGAGASADRRNELAALKQALDEGLPNDPFDPRVRQLKGRFIAFRRAHYGTPEAIAAAQLMSRMPWPADALRREDIPAVELAAAGDGNPANAPPELVTVLGDSRLKHWLNVYRVAFAPDGTLHSAGANGVLRQWNADTGEPVGEVFQYGGYPAQTAFSNDCSKVAVMFGGKLQLVDRAAGKTRTVPGIQSAYNHGLAWSPDGKTVAKGNADGTISLFDFETGALVKTLQGHDRVVRVVVFSPDGKALASTGKDGTVRWWPLDGGQPRTFHGHTRRGMGVVFTSDGSKLVSASEDRTLRVWSIENGECLHVLRGHAQQIHAIAIAPDGATVASTDSTGEIKIWDVERGMELRSFDVYGWPNALDFSPDGKVLAQAIEGSVLLWDVRTGKRLNKRSRHDSFVMSVAISDDGRMIASTGKDRALQLVDLATLESVDEVIQPETEGRRGFNSVTFIGDATTVAATERTGIVRIWDFQTGELRASLDAHPSDQLFAMATSPDGTTLASSATELYLWDLRTGTLLHTIPAHTPSVTAAAFAADGATLVTGGSDGLVNLWDVATGALKQALRGHTSRVMSVAVSPDGNTLASVAFDQTVRLWDMPSGRLRYTLTKHVTAGSPNGWGQLASVDFSPDGSLLASTAYDGTIRLWDPQTGGELKAIKICPPYGLIGQVAFTPEGRHLVTANGNGTVYVLRVGQHAN